MTTLSAILTGQGTWPPPDTLETWEQIELFAALRSSNETRLRQEASAPYRHRYLIAPLPRMVSRASANGLFGEEPDFSSADEGDQDSLERIVVENELTSEAHRGAMIASSEGEVWGKLAVAPDVLDVPVLEFVSRARVIPQFAGRFAVAATFITEWHETAMETVRLLETYSKGRIDTKLYRGTRTRLGSEISLASYDRTKGRVAVQLTGVPWPLVAYIPNSIDTDPTRGFSDYQGLQERFLALNEATTVGRSNIRLAGRKRAIVDAGYTDDRGRLPDGDDVFIRSSRHGGDDASAPKPLQMLEYDPGVQPLIAWIDHMIDTTLTFAGLSPQSVGRSVDGGAISGTALKLKQSHTLMEQAGKGRYFDRGLTRLLRGAQLLDRSNFKRPYKDADSPPTVQRGDGLPRDDIEAAQQITALYAADAISLEERVRLARPDLNEAQQTDEVERIQAETAPLELPQ